ncbi:MAG: response regulator [Acidobacteria bacterium]|nr:response regulator [Acidobacteriota bacterium]
MRSDILTLRNSPGSASEFLSTFYDRENHALGGIEILKILIVEDDEELLNGLDIILTKEGYGVLRTSEGETGLDIVVREKPNLIILDTALPGISGLDMCRELRGQGVKTPIILMSAKADAMDRRTGSYPDVNEYIAKPFGWRELLSCVRTQLHDI